VLLTVEKGDAFAVHAILCLQADGRRLGAGSAVVELDFFGEAGDAVIGEVKARSILGIAAGEEIGRTEAFVVSISTFDGSNFVAGRADVLLG
jgi:hypothetical protein